MTLLNVTGVGNVITIWSSIPAPARVRPGTRHSIPGIVLNWVFSGRVTPNVWAPVPVPWIFIEAASIACTGKALVQNAECQIGRASCRERVKVVEGAGVLDI